MKATYRNGKGSADHNDRKYLTASEQDKNEVISKWQLFSECDSFRDNEIKAYEQLFGEWLKGVNDRKRKDGHPEKCKTISDLVGKPNESKKKGRYEPTESLLQIGKDGEEVDEDIFRACVDEFIGITSQLYGSNMQWLDIAIHFENSSVGHAHCRRVWFAYDENGNMYPAKKDALRQLGFEVRTDDDRYNNATTRQTEEERQLWYDICKAHGLEIDTEPNKDNTKHLSIKDYKKKRQEELAQAKKDIDKNYSKALEEFEKEQAEKLKNGKKAIEQEYDNKFKEFATTQYRKLESKKKSYKETLEDVGFNSNVNTLIENVSR